jgi:hypothetical protein
MARRTRPRPSSSITEAGIMSAADSAIAHERLMAAFADLNRMVEQRKQRAQTAAQSATQAQQ